MEEIKGRMVITSGRKFIDIDAYASCIVYANILSRLGINAIAVTTAQTNESIPKSMLENNKMLDTYKYQTGDKFIILDVSNKEYFDTFVKIEDIIQIIDHHYGFEKYWKDILGKNAIIEPIGSVATIIYEIAEKTKYIKEMSQEEIYLLMAAMLDNTLNFKAKITSRRDIIAYDKLSQKVQDHEFSKKYFEECQNVIQSDLEYYVPLATKCEEINDRLPIVFSQLVVWNKEWIFLNLEKIYREIDKQGEDGILNLIVLEEERSYIISKNNDSKKKIERLFNLKFNGNILKLSNVWLRKEIIKEALQKCNFIDKNRI